MLLKKNYLTNRKIFNFVMIIFIVFCVSFTFVACLSSDPDEVITLSKGDSYTIDGFTIQLLSVTTAKTDTDDYRNYRADDGKTYVFVEFKLKNNRTEDVHIRKWDFNLVVLESGAEFEAQYSYADNAVSSYTMKPYDEGIRVARFEVADVVVNKKLKVVFDSSWHSDDGITLEWVL